MKHAYRNARPVLAKSCFEWEDLAEFERHLDRCIVEAAEFKTNLNYYTLYVQKPSS